MELHKEEGTREDLVKYRIETAKELILIVEEYAKKEYDLKQL